MVLQFSQNGTGYEFDAVVWDIDGTLVTTHPRYIEKVVAETLGFFEIPVPEGFTRRFWHQSGRGELVERVLGVSPDDFFPVFNALDKPEVRDKATFTFDDIGVLAILADQVKQGVVTTAPEAKARLNLLKIGPQYFGDAVVIANRYTAFPAKPNPAGLIHCMEILGVTPDRTLYVGNGDEDIGAARNAGATSCIVNRGEWPITEEPDFHVDTLVDLIQYK